MGIPKIVLATPLLIIISSCGGSSGSGGSEEIPPSSNDTTDQVVQSDDPSQTDTSQSQTPIVFEYVNFENPSDLNIQGDAASDLDNGVDSSSVLRLTSSQGDFQTGTAFHTNAVPLESFEVEFSFRITDSNGFIDRLDETGADGLTILFQTLGDVVGASGGALGYGGIEPSVAIEIDTYANSGDPDSNHVGVNINGDTNSLNNSVFVEPKFDDENQWFGWIDYQQPNLEIRLSQSSLRPDVATLTTSIDIPATIGASGGFVGFTSATGLAHSNHDILSWSYRSNSGAQLADPNPVNEPDPTTGGSEAIVADSQAITGSEIDINVTYDDSFFRVVVARPADPFDVRSDSADIRPNSLGEAEVTLSVPWELGEHEIRIIDDEVILFRKPLTVVAPSINAPDTGFAGGEVDVEWSGPLSFFRLRLAEVDAVFDNSFWSADIRPDSSAQGVSEAQLPFELGTLELRIINGENIVARREIELVPIEITGPGSAMVGSTVEFSYVGPSKFVRMQVAEPDAPFDIFLSSKDIRPPSTNSGTVELTMPSTPGTYEVRMAVNEGVFGRLSINVQ